MTSTGNLGDPGDFGDFVRATGTRLYHQALLLTGDHHLAEDLTQTTYAKLFASWGRVRRASDPTGYAIATLTRTFLSERRLRRNSERPVDVVPDRVGPQVDHDQRLDLAAALADLSADDRTVLVLRYWQDLTTPQIARVIGISEAACRKRLARAHSRLRDLHPTQGDS